MKYLTLAFSSSSAALLRRRLRSRLELYRLKGVIDAING